MRRVIAAVALAVASATSAQETERLMLSGTGYGDTVRWEFTVSAGRRAGEPATIPVPSQWEQHGFGAYNYGHDDDKSREQGRYRRRFRVPAGWHGKTVDLVFDGVMTDTEVRINGRPAGEVHRGAFYRFRYDVTDLLLADAENLLEVTVSKHSSDTSVNRAERQADYWVFGGIYRPVYLEARPPESIGHVAIDARHDGTLVATVRLRSLTGPARLTARVESLDGEAVGAPFSAMAGVETTVVEPRARLTGVRPWSAERPNLYRLIVELERGGRVPPEGDKREIAPEGDKREIAPEGDKREISPKGDKREISPKGDKREISPEGDKRKISPEGDKRKMASEGDRWQIVHRHAEHFGFRTVEQRSDGLLVNGRRVLLKGVNRHAFWPASGRTLNRELDFRDAELIKGMNMNAVRASHYPPDQTFLEACDRLGIYVIDELAGWHDAYGTEVGRRLVREMVERDVNHPSVILWANGNEGGWNQSLDEVFAEHDAQRRVVIHPHEHFGGFDTVHYPTFSELEASLDSASLKNRWRSLFGDLALVMPTEILHGLYDGGSGAGLDDYWLRLRASPRAAGAFLWSFADEAIERTDRGGQLDTDGNHAPDGVLGPYRELSGNYYAVREIFSPVRVVGKQRFDGWVMVENRFDNTDLSDCRFDWSLLDLPPPGGGRIETLEAGTLQGPAASPGTRGRLSLPPEVDWHAADALSLTASDPSGRDLWTWVLPTSDPRAELQAVVVAPGAPIEVTERDGHLTLRSASTAAEFDLESGRLLSLSHTGLTNPVLVYGPHPVDGARTIPSMVRHHARDGSYAVDVRYRSGLTSAHWLLMPSGWLRLSYRFEAEGAKDFFGVRFDLAETTSPSAPSGGTIEKVRWLGDGPSRVWKNRLSGGTLGLWEKTATAVTHHLPPFGEASVEAAHEPELAGYYSGVVWAELTTAESRLFIALESSAPPEGGKWDNIYLGLFSPTSPGKGTDGNFPADARDAAAAVPGGISLLHGISAIGTKFHPPEDLGPQSRRAVAAGAYHGVVWFHLGPVSGNPVMETGARSGSPDSSDHQPTLVPASP